MKTLSLMIDVTGLNLQKEDENKTPQQLSVDVMKNIVIAYGQQVKGLGEEDRRKFYKMGDVFDAALKDPAIVEVSLEDDWMGFLKKAFREVKCLPNLLLRRVEENVLTK